MEDREDLNPAETDEDVEGHSANPASANPAEREATPVEDDDVEGHGFNPSSVNPA